MAIYKFQIYLFNYKVDLIKADTVANIYILEHPKFKMTTPQLNHITLKFQSFPLLTQREMITKDMFCNETTVKNCTSEFCHCTHVLKVSFMHKYFK